MHPNLVICIFATAFVLIQCEFKLASCFLVEDDAPLEFTETNCKNKAFKHLRRNAIPRPPQALDTFVKLGGNFKYNPSTVIVKRCDGQCYGGQTLEAVGKSFREVEVIRSSETTDRTCGILRVEDHTECDCKCRRNESDCQKTQKFNSNTCACECRNGYDKMDFDCGQKKEYGVMLWNRTTCSCECEKDYLYQKCMTDSQRWNEKKCRCEDLKGNPIKRKTQ